MIKKNKQKNKVSESLETSLSVCIRVLVPMLVVILPALLLIGFIVIQVNNMYSGDWISFKDNVFYLGGLVASYLLGSTPKEGVLSKFT